PAAEMVRIILSLLVTSTAPEPTATAGEFQFRDATRMNRHSDCRAALMRHAHLHRSPFARDWWRVELAPENVRGNRLGFACGCALVCVVAYPFRKTRHPLFRDWRYPAPIRLRAEM